MSRYEYRALTPWSFFLPIALAVALGVLVANALGGALFGERGDSATEIATEAAVTPETSPDTAAAPPVEDKTVPARSDVIDARAAEATPAPSSPEPSPLEPVHLPGPSSARRDGDARACIGGTIAVRAANGWEQEMVDDAPARCVADSN